MNRNKQHIALLAVVLTLLSCGLSPRQRSALAAASSPTESAEESTSNATDNSIDGDKELCDKVLDALER